MLLSMASLLFVETGGDKGATVLLLLGRVCRSSGYALFLAGNGGGVSSSSGRASDVDLGASELTAKSLAQSENKQTNNINEEKYLGTCTTRFFITNHSIRSLHVEGPKFKELIPLKRKSLRNFLNVEYFYHYKQSRIRKPVPFAVENHINCTLRMYQMFP